MKIHRYTIESALVLFACLNIVFLNNAVPGFSYFLYMLRLLLIAYILLSTFVSREYFSNTMKIILLFVLWIFIISIVRDGAVSDAIRALSIPILLSLYINLKRNRAYIVECIGVWANLLFALVLIDFITQIIFPTGMYSDSMYSLNWFLGYKTARLVYALPLCIFESIYSMWKNNKLSWKSYICFIMSIYTLYHSEATSASVTLVIACIIVILLCIGRKRRGRSHFWEYFVNFKIVIPFYIVITVLIVYIQNAPFIQYIIVDILGKDTTLTTRTYIWRNCIEVLKTHPTTGIGYLSIQRYQEIANSIYATSAHNMSLTILISGGFIAVALYIGIVIAAWNSLEKDQSIYNKIASIGIISVLIVGLTSSSALFSLCGFVFYTIIGVNISLNKADKIFSVNSKWR
ncbi:MAG: hypothetical protein K0S04_2280 [Herbinix sp.]|jgi:O-antigen ligase|nr:hypothetical protein [Herbinix sp.]